MSNLNKYGFSILILLISFSCGKKKPDDGKLRFDKASEYHQYINERYENVNRLWNVSVELMDDSSKIYFQLDSLQQASRLSMNDMKNLGDYKADTMYRHAALEYFSLMDSISRGSYKEAIGICLIGEGVSDSLYFKFTAIQNQIAADKDTCIERLKAANLNFMKLSSK